MMTGVTGVRDGYRAGERLEEDERKDKRYDGGFVPLVFSLRQHHRSSEALRGLCS